MSSKQKPTRTRILQSALRLLTARGYHGVGLEEVAHDAGLSRQSVYLHFKSKADLVVEMARYQDEAAGTAELLRPVMEASSASGALDRGIAAYGAIEPLIYDAAAVLYAARRSEPAAESAWQDRMAFRRANIRRGMEALRQEGLLADGWTVDEATDFAWALLSLHTYEYLVVERHWTIANFVARLTSMVRSTLLVQPHHAE
jgi:AcrR family transcriptional regulator